MADLDGAGGAKTFTIDFSTDTSIANFVAFGTGSTPADPAELDTLALDIAAANLLLEQAGTGVVVSVVDDPTRTGTVTLEDTALEQLDNIAGAGNFLFAGQSKVTDGIDVWSAALNGSQVFRPSIVTFLNDLDNKVTGFDEGNDVINGLAGNDTLNGFSGNDLLRGGEGDDSLIGGLKNDRLQGGDGNDTLTGGRGDDVLDGGGGEDVMTGGKGNDVYFVDSLGDIIVEDIQNSRSGGWADEVRSSISFSLAPYTRIENLTLLGGSLEGSEGTGNSSANVITGNDSANTLNGAGGNDILVGGGGVDEFHGDSGNDTIVLGKGDDDAADVNGDPTLVDGGSGFDTVAPAGFGRELDLTTDLRERFASIEMFDLGTGGPTTLVIDAANVTQMAASNGKTMLIRGAADDLLAFGDSGWAEDGTKVNPFGQVGIFTAWTNGTATVLVEQGVGVSSSNIDIATLSEDEGFKIAGAAIVGSAGDVNADGFDDVIVGAPGADPFGRADAGESYVIYGKAGGVDDIDLATLTPAQGFKLSGGAAGDASGASVSRTGDVNGDGIEDFIVGAPLADPLGRDGAGESYVIYGKEGGLSDIDLGTLTPAQGFKMFGAVPGAFFTLESQFGDAGDVNGDGIDDILVRQIHEGLCYLIYGKAGGLGDIDLAALTPADGTTIASPRMVDGAGDINGDGIDDIVAGTIGHPFDRDGAGEAFVIYGKIGGIGDINLDEFTPAQGFRIAGAKQNDASGYAVSAAGDINGDGIADIIIGSKGELSSGNYAAGLAYVVYGKDGGQGDIDLAALTPAEGFKITGVSFEQFTSLSVSDAGDVNGDGIDDVIVDGAFVIYGKAGGLADIELAGLTDDQGFRISTGDRVSRAGDVDGDGFADLIVGTEKTGESAVIYGGNFTKSVTQLGTDGDDTLTGGSGEVFVGGLGNDVLGNSFGDGNAFHGGAGDDLILAGTGQFGDPILVDGGSGIDTLKASEFGNAIDLTGNLRDRVESIEILDLEGVASIALTLDSSTVTHMSGSNGSAFGPNTVLIKGDGDFEGDVVTLADSGWAIDGEVTDPFGQKGTYARWINGEATALIETEVTVLAIGDIDLADLSPEQGFTITGVASGDQAGTAVSMVGDVNDDGIDDFIVGARGADPASGVGAGQSYVIFGKAGGLSDIDLATLTPTQGFKISGGAAGDGAGNSVSDAGDVNGDGIADLLVGAVGADPLGRPGAGETYVIYGKAGGPGDIDLGALTPAQGFTIAGVTDYSHSANTVRSAGDVNGDGIDDIILSAPSSLYQNGTAAAEAYVIYGKVGGLDDIDLRTLTSAQGFRMVNDSSTHFVNGIGDINGDGFDDVAVGAGAGVPGRGYVIYGQAGIPAVVDLRSLSGADGFQIAPFDESTESNGLVVSAAGDINGDGFEDLAVADAEQGPYSGRTAVIYGKAGGPGDIDLSTLTSDQGFSVFGVGPYDASGRSISSAGDVNGDGIDDLLIGAPEADPGGREDAGEAYLIFGKAGGLGDINLATLTSDVGLKLSGAGEDDATGRSVRAAGDINGDGYADIVIGAPDAQSNGKAYVVYGGDLTGAVTHAGTAGDDTLTGSGADEVFIGGLGNDRLEGGGGKDAFHGGAGDDVIVLAPGEVVRVDGGNGIDTVAVSDIGPALDFTAGLRDRFQSIEILDLDQFNVDHVTLDAASIARMTGSNGGAFGPNTLLVKGDGPDIVTLADQGWVEGGEVVDPFGQTGTYTSWTNGTVTLLASGVDVFPMSRVDLADLTPDEGFKIAGASDVGLAGDINNDGIDDFVVSADKSYVIFGKAGGLSEIDLATLTPDQGFVVSRTVPGDDAGVGGGATGDFNGDGIDDVIFGSPVADAKAGVDAGQAYVIFGSSGGPGDVDVASMPPGVGFTISGGAAGDNAGFVATSTGDFNGDGIDDILVNARKASPDGRLYAGESYVIYGQLNTGDVDLGALTPDRGFRIAGETSVDYAGEAASSAGDINGDGFDDIIIGAPFFSFGIGRGYVIYGNAAGLGDIDLAALAPSAGFKLTGNGGYEDFVGRAVDSAGDINGDGIGDLVISAYRGGVDYSGITYVVYGKESGFSDLDLTTLTSDQGFLLSGFESGGEIGRSVASAGDVNGDGIDDILVGAPDLNVADREDAGQAFLIYGKQGGPGDIDVTNLGADQGFAISGAAAEDRAGQDVSAAGDINGDGFADLLVGAPYANSAYVLYGGDITGSVNHLGTANDDVLVGTAAAESFVGGLGNDVLVGAGGADAFQGAAGNDVIHAGDRTFQRADGGNGEDVLHLDFDGVIDFGDIDNNAATANHTTIRNIETIDTDNGFSNQLTLQLADVLEIDAQNSDVGGVSEIDNVLKIDGEIGDTLSLDPADGWSAPDTSSVIGYAIYAAASVKIAVDQDIAVAVA